MNEIERQIQNILDQAAERPMPNDPMNMIGLGNALLAAKMITLWAKQKNERLDYGEIKEDGNN